MNIFEKTSGKELSVVIPTFNEEKTIGKVLELTLIELSKINISSQIIVTDNFSTDKTLDIVKKYKDVLIHKEKIKGYGSNLKSAFKNINSKYVIFFDADLSYNPMNINKFYEKIIEKNLDMVIGNRLKKLEKGSMPIMHRFLGTPILSLLIRIFFGSKIYDCNCGMRILKMQTLKNIKFISEGMEFASEMIIKLCLGNYKIGEIEIYFERDLRGKDSHLSTWRDGWRHLRFIISFIKSNHLLFLIYFWFFMYSSLYILSFLQSDVGLPRFHTIFSLLSLTLLAQSIMLGIINIRLGLFYKNHINCFVIDSILKQFEKNLFMKIFIISFLIMFIELISLTISWSISSFGNIVYLEKMIRVLLYATFCSFFINLDLQVESWKISNFK